MLPSALPNDKMTASTPETSVPLAADNRDEFSPGTKDLLAKRAGYMCAFPGCRRLTVGPSEDRATQTTMVGVAAHITAGSARGPRYDAWTLASRGTLWLDQCQRARRRAISARCVWTKAWNRSADGVSLASRTRRTDTTLRTFHPRMRIAANDPVRNSAATT